ncbi:MAG: putative transcriptional regulatory protein for hcr operon [Pseudonocardia sp.]|nr:putative transcriptional regulatory protein for hcr operon [Pseudonocardia sp.]
MTADQTVAVDRLVFLLARHGRVMNVRLRAALGLTGLSPRHGATLVRLAHVGATSQQALIEALAVDASALVALLNDLERDGLVERRRDPADRRRHIVEITGAGRQAISAVDDAIAEVEREAFADLTDVDVAQLHALLARVRTRASDTSC